MLAKVLSSRIKRVFVSPIHEFALVWNGKQYVLKDQYKPICYPLEAGLIGLNGLTGNKIKDLQKILGKSVKWILGFHHGLTKQKIKYSNIEYKEGFVEGEQFNIFYENSNT